MSVLRTFSRKTADRQPTEENRDPGEHCRRDLRRQEAELGDTRGAKRHLVQVERRPDDMAIAAEPSCRPPGSGITLSYQGGSVMYRNLRMYSS